MSLWSPDDVANGRLVERLEMGALHRVPGRLAHAARVAIGQT